MKRKIFLSVILFSGNINAQVQKGAIYPELSVSRNMIRMNATTYHASVSAGISKQSTLGIFYSRTNYGSPDVSRYNGYSLKTGGGLTYTWYRYFNRKSKWGWFINAEAGLYKVKVFEKTGSSYNLNNKYLERELTLNPGVFFTPSPRVMLFAGLGGISVYGSKYQFADFSSSFLSRGTIGIRFTLGGNGKKRGR